MVCIYNQIYRILLIMSIHSCSEFIGDSATNTIKVGTWMSNHIPHCKVNQYPQLRSQGNFIAANR